MMLTDLYTPSRYLPAQSWQFNFEQVNSDQATTDPLKIHLCLNLFPNIEKFFHTLAEDLLDW